MHYMSRKKPLIYMAELTYATTVISIESFPIAVGYVTAYAQKKLTDFFSFKIFKFPDDLFEAIDHEPPDVLGMSFFPWNRNLCLRIAKYYKELKPNGLVVFGGTNFTFIPNEQKNFLNKNPQVDIVVLCDGEYGFVEILNKYLENDARTEDILTGEVLQGCVFLDKKEKEFKAGDIFERPVNIDEFPSPYLSGLMNPFFDNQLLTPMVQTTRGCPFSCGYCWAGNHYNSQIRHFSTDRVAAELEFIAVKRKRKRNQLLTFADSNFGMYPKDEKIADKIRELQDKHNFPNSFYSPCGKNNKDRVYRIIKKIKNAAAIVSVQSTDSKILKNIHRQPINIEEYKDFVDRLKALEIPVETEIITGLPGETRQSHLQTIKDLIYMGMDEIHAFTLMFLEGTDINSEASQENYQWHKRYRVLPRNFGKFKGKVCLEVETVGVGSNTFSFEDYMYLRGLHGALRIVFNHAFFIEFLNYLKHQDINLFSFTLQFYKNIKKEPGPAGNQFRAFMKEARKEIWDSEKALWEYYQKEEIYQKLLTGDKGENLLGKYKIITICENFDSWCEFYNQQSLIALKEKKPNEILEIREELMDIKNHIIAKAHQILTFQNAKGQPKVITLHHNILQWIKENYVCPLSKYKFARGVKVEYKIRQESRRIVNEILVLHSKEKASFWKAASSRYYLPAIFREGRLLSP